MSKKRADANRARRLLRCYPRAWRDRYEDEFVDLLEQEMAETPHSIRRTSNIIYKGLAARLGDVGLAESTINPVDQFRAVAGTAYVLMFAFVIFALHYWSTGMAFWNNTEGTAQSPIVVTLWLGAATVLVVVLAVSLVVFLGILLWSAGSDFARQRTKEISRPFVIVVASVLFFTCDAYPEFKFQSSLQGIDWANPGVVIKLLAGAIGTTLMDLKWVWGHLNQFPGGGTWAYTLAPLVLVAFAVNAATLIRRTQFTPAATRAIRLTMTALTLAMALFPVCYLGWVVAGGPPTNLNRLLQENYTVYRAEFGLMILIAALGVHCARRSRRISEAISK